MKKTLLIMIVIAGILVSCSNKETLKEPPKKAISEPVIEEVEEETETIIPIKTYTASDDGSFNVNESIDLDEDMEPETLAITGGSLGDDYIGEIALSISKGVETYQIELINEGSSTFYVHDLNTDGIFEISFNGGYRIGLIKLYVLTESGLQVLQEDTSGWVQEISNNEIITDRGTYTFDGTNLIDQQGKSVTSLIAASSFDELESSEEEYEDTEEYEEDAVEVVEEQPDPTPTPIPKDEYTLAYEAEINQILSELQNINDYFNEVIANQYPGEEYVELADMMTSIALKNHSLKSMKVDGLIPPEYFGAHDDLSKSLEYYVKAAEILAALCYSSGSISEYHIHQFEEKYATRIDLAITYIGYALDDYLENGFILE